MNEIETATDLFSQGFSCSQSVFAPFAERFGIPREIALRLADGFGGGIGRQGMTCGALAGAVMALGLELGRSEADDFESKRRTVMAVRELTAAFTKEFGSCRCSDLLGFDISIEEMKPGAHGADPRFARCGDFVRFAAERTGNHEG